MQLTDSELVAAALRGDQSGIAGMYDRYADRLTNYAWSVSRSHADAGDIVQDTFVTAAQRLGQLRDPERLRPWLYAIARHHALRVIRQRQRVEVHSEIDMITDFPQPDGGLDAQQLVWSAAAGLDAKDRDILSLHLREGLDGEDLAAALGIKPNAANVALFRVRERLELAVGALLLTRFAAGACSALDALMAAELTPLVRKRATRHIEGCDACQASRRRIGSPAALFAATPAVLAPAALRDTVIGAWGSANAPPHTEIQSWRKDGFPEGPTVAPAPGPAPGRLTTPDQTVRRARFAAVAGMVAVITGFGFFAFIRDRPETVTQIAATETVPAQELETATTLADLPPTVLAQPGSVPELTTPSSPTTAPTAPPTTPAPTSPPTSAAPSTTIVDNPAPPQLDPPVNEGPDELAPESVNLTVLEFECGDFVTVRLRVTGSANPTVVVRFERNAFEQDVELTESLTEENIYEGELEKFEGEHKLTALAESGSASDSELLSESCGQIG